MTEGELVALDRRLLAVADRAVTYRPEFGRELQALVNDAREHLSSGELSLATANAMVAAVEARSLTLALLDGAAGGSSSRPSASRPSASRPSSSSSPITTDAAAGAAASSGRALASVPGASSAASWWAGLSPVTRVGLVAVASALAVYAWRKWKGAADVG